MLLRRLPGRGAGEGGELGGWRADRHALERAHLQAVRFAVEQTPELLELQPKAIQNLNQTIMKDPPPEAGSRDLAAAEDVHELALGSVQRLMDWHRRNPGITF